jgi:hypothetical protein
MKRKSHFADTDVPMLNVAELKRQWAVIEIMERMRKMKKRARKTVNELGRIREIMTPAMMRDTRADVEGVIAQYKEIKKQMESKK